MDNLVGLALEIQQILDGKGYRFYFIGGLAVQFWGQNRLTDDIDLNLITEFKNEDEIVQDLFTCYRPRRPDALEMAQTARVVLLENADGIAIDVALGGFPFEVEAFENSVLLDIPGRGKLRLINPEDLIIMKAFAARPHDWRDIETIIAAQGLKSLNEKRIIETVTMLSDLKEEPEIVTKLHGLLADARK